MVWAGGGYGGQLAVRFDAKKVIRLNLFPGKKPGNREVYDIVKDPAEKNDIAAENRDLIDRAIAILDKEYKPAPGSRPCATRPQNSRPNKEKGKDSPRYVTPGILPLT